MHTAFTENQILRGCGERWNFGKKPEFRLNTDHRLGPADGRSRRFGRRSFTLCRTERFFCCLFLPCKTDYSTLFRAREVPWRKSCNHSWALCGFIVKLWKCEIVEICHYENVCHHYTWNSFPHFHNSIISHLHNYTVVSGDGGTSCKTRFLVSRKVR